MKIYPFRAIYPNFDLIASAESFFNTVKYKYPEYVKSGFFKRSTKDAMYIYQIKSADACHTALLATTDLDDVAENRVRKHEKTLSSNEQQMMHLILQRGAMIKPVMVTFPHVEALDQLLENYTSNHKVFFKTKFREEKTEHRFWQIVDGDVLKQLQGIFSSSIQTSYIADGHHRCSTTLLLRNSRHDRRRYKFDRILTAYFPFRQLRIWDYNRSIEILQEISAAQFIARLSTFLKIKPLSRPAKPRKKHEMTLLINREWYRLEWRKPYLRTTVEGENVLDTQLFNDLILERICGVRDVRTDERIRYIDGTKGIDGLIAHTLKRENRVAFCMYPVQLEAVIDQAEKNKSLPPKSTWFEPRLKNGLIVQEF